MNILRLACRRESRVRLRVRTFRSKMQAIGDRFGWAHLPSRRRTPFSPCSPRVDLNAGPNRGKDVSGDSCQAVKTLSIKAMGFEEAFYCQAVIYIDIKLSGRSLTAWSGGPTLQLGLLRIIGGISRRNTTLQLHGTPTSYIDISMYRFTDNVQAILSLLLKHGGTSGARAATSPSVRRR
jgi:hypothetical protein